MRILRLRRSCSSAGVEYETHEMCYIFGVKYTSFMIKCTVQINALEISSDFLRDCFGAYSQAAIPACVSCVDHRDRKMVDPCCVFHDQMRHENPKHRFCLIELQKPPALSCTVFTINTQLPVPNHRSLTFCVHIARIGRALQCCRQFGFDM